MSASVEAARSSLRHWCQLCREVEGQLRAIKRQLARSRRDPSMSTADQKQLVESAVESYKLLHDFADKYQAAKDKLELLMYTRRMVGKDRPSPSAIDDEELEWNEKVLDEELVPSKICMEFYSSESSCSDYEGRVARRQEEERVLERQRQKELELVRSRSFLITPAATSFVGDLGVLRFGGGSSGHSRGEGASGSAGGSHKGSSSRSHGNSLDRQPIERRHERNDADNAPLPSVSERVGGPEGRKTSRRRNRRRAGRANDGQDRGGPRPPTDGRVSAPASGVGPKKVRTKPDGTRRQNRGRGYGKAGASTGSVAGESTDREPASGGRGEAVPPVLATPGGGGDHGDDSPGSDPSSSDTFFHGAFSCSIGSIASVDREGSLDELDARELGKGRRARARQRREELKRAEELARSRVEFQGTVLRRAALELLLEPLATFYNTELGELVRYAIAVVEKRGLEGLYTEAQARGLAGGSSSRPLDQLLTGGELSSAEKFMTNTHHLEESWYVKMANGGYWTRWARLVKRGHGTTLEKWSKFNSNRLPPPSSLVDPPAWLLQDLVEAYDSREKAEVQEETAALAGKAPLEVPRTLRRRRSYGMISREGAPSGPG